MDFFVLRGSGVWKIKRNTLPQKSSWGDSQNYGRTSVNAKKKMGADYIKTTFC